MRVHKRYGGIVADVTGDVREAAWSEEDFGNLKVGFRSPRRFW